MEFVKIKGKGGHEFLVLAKKDFDPKKHELFEGDETGEGAPAKKSGKKGKKGAAEGDETGEGEGA